MSVLFIALYIVFLLGLSLYVGSRPKPDPGIGLDAAASEEFAIGSRQAGFLSVFASSVTLIGGGELLLVASLGFLGEGAAISLLSGYSLGFLLLGFLAPRLRAKGNDLRYHSLPDYFRIHYGAAAGFFASSLTFLAFFALLILQFSAGVIVLTSLIRMSPLAAALLCAAVIVVYLVFAGFRGVLVTDLVQLTVMLIGLPILAFLFVRPSTALEELGSLSFQFLPTLAALATGTFVILGSGDIWQRMYGARTDRVARNAFFSSAIGFFFFTIVIALVGIGARIANLTDNPDEAFVTAALQAASEWPFFGAIVLLTVFSAVLSTADTETFLLGGMLARAIKRFGSADSDKLVTVSQYRLYLPVVALLGALAGLRTERLIDIYSFLLLLLLAMAPPVLIGCFRVIPRWAINSSIGLALLLLIGIQASAGFTLDYAVLVVVPGLVICYLASKKGEPEAAPLAE